MQVRVGYYITKDKKMIQHNKPTLGERECLAACRIIKSGWIAQGKEVKNFENAFCDFLGLPAEHAVAVSSGTAALFIALSIMNARNKTIAYPAYTCSAIRNAVDLSGAKHLVIDSEKNSPNIDMNLLNCSVSDIVITPHMYGLPAAIKKALGRITIIEDCAQSIGAKINGEFVGLIGEIGIFSFYATKMITSGGEGGMIVSKDKEIIEAARDYREFDQRNDKKKRFNFQMTDLQAAIGYVQLQEIQSFIDRRREIFKQYLDAGIPLLTGEKEAVPYRAIMLTDHVDEKILQLKKRDINAINPLETWELLGEKEKFINAYQWTRKTLSLPIYPDLKNEEVKRIINEVNAL